MFLGPEPYNHDFFCGYRAAALMTQTGHMVNLKVAKQGAIYHGLATLLSQPSPIMQRGTTYSTHHQGPVAQRVDTLSSG